MIRYLKVAYLSLELGTTSSYRLSSAPVNYHRGMSFIVCASIRSGRLYIRVKKSYIDFICGTRLLEMRLQ